MQQSPLFRRATAFYHRHQRIAPIVFFFAGVAWDTATLNRIDAWGDNLLLLAYILIVGGLIMVAALVDQGVLKDPRLKKYEEWFPAGIQFFLGALFSAYVIFYSQSASLTETSAFLVLLVILLVANEFIHQRLFNLYLLFALYFLAVFSFLTFFIPVVARQVNYLTFVAAGVLAVGIVGVMQGFLWRRGVFPQRRQVALAFGIVVVLFGGLNVFYHQNWIPPVPLALRHGGVYHHVEKLRNEAGETVFRLRYEQPPWYAFWERSDAVFHRAPGERVYCFTAVFAPTDLEKRIYHEWRYWDEAQQAWISTDRIGYDITGGREFGYRGYTMKQHVRPGRWRVEVQTADGRLLGRIRFRIVEAEVPVAELAERIYR